MTRITTFADRLRVAVGDVLGDALGSGRNHAVTTLGATLGPAFTEGEDKGEAFARRLRAAVSDRL